MKRMKGSILMKNTKTKSIVALAIVLVLTLSLIHISEPTRPY